MKIKCITVDDEPPALALVKSYIEKTSFLSLEGAFLDPLAALELVRTNSVQLIFLDINMPDLNGMELARMLPDFCRVIFTTAYEDYALESYSVAALDYLVKPFSYEDFWKAAQKARDYFSLSETRSEAPAYMFIKADHKLNKVFFAEILFVENIKDYVRIYLKDGSKLMALMPLKTLLASLPDSFMKVHRSYIVNLDAIGSVERNRVIFGTHYVPVADSYRVSFQKYLSDRSVN